MTIFIKCHFNYFDENLVVPFKLVERYGIYHAMNHIVYSGQLDFYLDDYHYIDDVISHEFKDGETYYVYMNTMEYDYCYKCERWYREHKCIYCFQNIVDEECQRESDDGWEELHNSEIEIECSFGPKQWE